jgi:hypothetical protein
VTRPSSCPKLYRLATASLQPDAFVVEMLERDPGALVTFTFELASYRLFMDRLLAGDASPTRHRRRHRARPARLAEQPDRALPPARAAPARHRRGPAVIARIARPQTPGGPQFVALHRDERAPSRAVWVPVRGDRGRTGETSWPRAARLCARALRAQIDRAYAGAHSY